MIESWWRAVELLSTMSPLRILNVDLRERLGGRYLRLNDGLEVYGPGYR